MVKDCYNCIYSDRPSYDYPCTACESAYGSAPSKWEGVVAANADMVEVVRCKDCVNWEAAIGCEEALGYCELEINVHGTSGCWYRDDFCSYGEREDND